MKPEQQFFQCLQHDVNSGTRDLAQINDHTFGYMLTQMTVRAGIKKHGEAAVDALFAEFAQ
jgi:hypothetical protein